MSDEEKLVTLREMLSREVRRREAAEAENAALREIVEVVAACEYRKLEVRWRVSGGLARVGLWDSLDRHCAIRDKARELLGKTEEV